MSSIEQIRALPFPNSLAAFNLACDFKPEPLQFMAQIDFIRKKETANCWGRQLGKTYWQSIASLYLSTIHQLRGCYLTPQEDQCSAPIEYWSSTPFFDGMSNNWAKIGGKKMIKIGPITNNLVRSSHVDFINFDEVAFARPKQEMLIKVAKKMIQNSTFQHVSYTSTPLIASQFEKDFYRLQRRGDAYRYTYQDFKVNDIYPTWIQPALDEIEETRIMVEEGHYPRWLFLQETMAEFAAQGGSIFSDYEEKDLHIDPFLPEYIGIDINPKAGHTATVAVKPYPNCIYYKEVIDLTTDTRLAANIIKNRMRHNTSVELELNGAGEEAVKVFYEVLGNDYLGYFTGIEWTEQLKFNRVMEMLKHHIIVSHQAKKFFDQLRGASWDPAKKLSPLKTSEDHWIDAGYHSAHWASNTISASAY